MPAFWQRVLSVFMLVVIFMGFVWFYHLSSEIETGFTEQGYVDKPATTRP